MTVGTTRVSTMTNGAGDLYSVQDLTETGPINSVTVHAIATGVDSCAPPPISCIAAIKLVLRTSGVSSTSPSTFVDGSEISYTRTTSPATGQPWTAAEVNALEAGVTKTAGLSTVVDQVWVMVDIGDDTTYDVANGPAGMNTLGSSLTHAGVTTSFTYDANGNLNSKTLGSSKTCYEWNAEDLLTKVKSVSSVCTETGSQQQAYTYDGLGRRVKVDGVAGSGAWTVSIVSGMDVIFEKDNAGAVTKYVYANGMRIAKITSAGIQYYLGDHLGSTRKVLDASRNTVFSTDYEPFGKPVASSGTEAYKYTSEKHDDPTGLVYLRARQYDPDIGRFVSADPVLGSLSRPQTQNRYVYVANNPLKFRDPSGRVGMPFGNPRPLPSGPDPVLHFLEGQWNGFFTGDSLEWNPAGLPPDFPTACNSGGCYNPGHNAANQWRSLDPNVRRTIMVAAVLVVGTILTMGAIDLIGAGALAGEAAIGGGEAGIALDEGTAGIPDDAIAAADPVVRHFTNDGNAALIEQSGYLKLGTYVTLPGEIPPGASQSEVENLLGLTAGKGAMYIDVNVGDSLLGIPPEGPMTAGGAWQRILVKDYPIGEARFQYWRP